MHRINPSCDYRKCAMAKKSHRSTGDRVNSVPRPPSYRTILDWSSPPGQFDGKHIRTDGAFLSSTILVAKQRAAI